MVVGSVSLSTPLLPLTGPAHRDTQRTHRTAVICLIGITAALLLGRVAAAPLSGLVTLREPSVRSYLVGNAGSRPISEAKQPWACLVLRWGTTGEAHVLYSPILFANSGGRAGCQQGCTLGLSRATGYYHPTPGLSHDGGWTETDHKYCGGPEEHRKTGHQGASLANTTIRFSSPTHKDR